MLANGMAKANQLMDVCIIKKLAASTCQIEFHTNCLSYMEYIATYNTMNGCFTTAPKLYAYAYYTYNY